MGPLRVAWFLHCVFIVVIMSRVPLCFSYNPPWKNGYNYHRTLPKDIMVDVINNLGLSLLEVHNEYNENNIAISPYGATSVLVAVAEGLLGEALHEIQHAVQLPEDLAVIRVGLRDIHRHLKSYFIPKEGFLAGLTLSHDNITLNREYESILRFYGYDIESFNNALYPDSFTTSRTVSMTQRTETTKALTDSTTKTIPTSTTIPISSTIKVADESTTLTPTSTPESSTTTERTTIGPDDVASTESLNTLKPERTTRGNGRPTKKRKYPTKLPTPVDEDITSTTKKLPTRSYPTITRRMPSETTTYSTTARETTRFTESTEEMLVKSESQYPSTNDLSTTEKAMIEQPTTVASTTINDVETETIPTITSTSTPTTTTEIEQTTTVTIPTTSVSKSNEERTTMEPLEERTESTVTTTMIPEGRILDTFSGVTIEEIITEAPQETTKIIPVTENTVSTTLSTIENVITNEQVEATPGITITEIIKAVTENVEKTTLNSTNNIDASLNEISTENLSDESISYDYPSTMEFLSTTSAEQLSDKPNLEDVSDLDVTETNGKEVIMKFLYSTTKLTEKSDLPSTSTISPTTLLDIDVRADFPVLAEEKAEYKISANISAKDNMKPLRRNTRSVIDYVIARYYDNYHITSNKRHPRPQYSYYHPDTPYTFLVNGKIREPNISFMTYDTVLPFYYIAGLDAMALSFPLDSNMYYLLLILPVDDLGIDKLIYDFRKVTTLKGVVENLRYTHVRAVIPSFMLKGYVVLTPSLQKLGIKKIFEPRHADFSQLTTERNIYVTNIEQAVTVTIKNYVDPSSISARNLQDYRPVEFKADHPFLYFVMDSQIHVNLMAGKIINPLNSRIR